MRDRLRRELDAIEHALLLEWRVNQTASLMALAARLRHDLAALDAETRHA